jgi:hypothetical protein
MARVESVSLIDDLDGGKADESLTFGLDGRVLEIDLSAAHARELRDLLAPYVGAARPASPRIRRSGSVRPSSSPADHQRNQKIRSWATENGYAVAGRGRIPAEVLQAFADRGNTPASTEAEEKPKRRPRKKSANP